MRYMIIALVVIGLLAVTGCSVNVVTVNGAEIQYTDAATVGYGETAND